MKKWILIAFLVLVLLGILYYRELYTYCCAPEIEPVLPEAALEVSPEYERVCIEGEKRNGPWNNDLRMVWMDTEGNIDHSTDTVFVESGGVPSVIQDESGRLVAAYQWFDCETDTAFDKVAVSFSEDEGKTWTYPTPIEVAGLPNEFSRPFDPTLVSLANGRIRLYFTSSEGSLKEDGNINIYSAISEDGIHYDFEDGERFGLDEERAYDSAVAFWKGLWHLVVPQNVVKPFGAYYATSEDGLHFTQQASLYTESEENWTGNFVVVLDEVLRFYGTPSKSNWIIETMDGETWSSVRYLESKGGDPAVVCLSNGNCLMIYVAVTLIGSPQ